MTSFPPIAVHLRRVFRERQADLGLTYVPRVGFRRKGVRVPGLTEGLRKYLYGRTPRFPKKWGYGGSSAARGRALDTLRDSLHEGTVKLEDAPEVLKWYYEETAKRGWKPIATQVVAAQGELVATAGDELFLGRNGELVSVEVKSGSMDNKILHSQFSKQVRTIFKGPFRKNRIQDSLFHRHCIQTAMTAHMIDETYGSKSIRVKEAWLVFLDRREFVCVSDMEWYSSRNLEAIGKLFVKT